MPSGTAWGKVGPRRALAAGSLGFLCAGVQLGVSCGHTRVKMST